MKERTTALVVAVLLLGIGWYLGSATAVARAQEPESGQTFVVPKAYGQLKAAYLPPFSNQGALVYEGPDGTIRVMVGPRVLQAIQRK